MRHASKMSKILGDDSYEKPQNYRFEKFAIIFIVFTRSNTVVQFLNPEFYWMALVELLRRTV